MHIYEKKNFKIKHYFVIINFTYFFFDENRHLDSLIQPTL